MPTSRKSPPGLIARFDELATLAAAGRADFLSRNQAGTFGPMPGRPINEHFVVRPSLLSDDAIGDWEHRSLAYANQLPAKTSRKKG